MERTDVKIIIQKNTVQVRYDVLRIRSGISSDNEAVFLHAGKALCKRQTS